MTNGTAIKSAPPLEAGWLGGAAREESHTDFSDLSITEFGIFSTANWRELLPLAPDWLLLEEINRRRDVLEAAIAACKGGV